MSSAGVIAASYVAEVAGGPTYSTVVLADAPLAYYRLGEASGTALLDSSGNTGRNGVYTGAPALGSPGLLATEVDTCVTFNGSSQFATVPWAAWQNSASFTVEAWIRSTGSGIRSIVDRDHYGDRRAWQFRLVNGSLEFLRVSDATGSISVITASAAGSLTDGLPHHVVATYDGTNVRLYIDGVLRQTTAMAGGILQPASATLLSIGANRSNSDDGPSAFFLGSVDEVALYGAELSAARVAAHYAAGAAAYARAVLADTPLAYYRLGDASGTVLGDASGNARNGTYPTAPALNAAPLQNGDSNKAADFTPTQFGLVADAAWLDAPAFTAEAWIKPDAVSSYRAVVTRDGTAGARGWNLYVQDGRLIVFHNDAARLTGSTTLVVGQTYHVALVSTGTQLTLYLNGVSDGTTAYTMSNALANALMIGASMAGVTAASLGFDGVIDEVAYYGSALTAAQIAAHYAASPQKLTGLVGSMSEAHYDIFAPSRLVDGSDATGAMFPRASAVGMWWQVDLGAVKTVHKAEFRQGYNTTTDGNAFPSSVLETSTDGVTWTTRGSQETEAPQIITVAGLQVQARYVRLRCTGPDAGWPSCQEIRVWGSV